METRTALNIPDIHSLYFWKLNKNIQFLSLVFYILLVIMDIAHTSQELSFSDSLT